MLLHEILDVGLLAVHPRARDVQLRQALRSVALELIGVEVVLLAVTATEEQDRLAELLALRLQRRALAQEAAERREPGPGTDHDDRAPRVFGKAESCRRLLHERMDHASFGLAAQERRAHALVVAAARACRP